MAEEETKEPPTFLLVGDEIRLVRLALICLQATIMEDGMQDKDMFYDATTLAKAMQEGR